MIIISANQSKWNNAKGPIRTQGKNRQTAPCAGKTRVTKSCLVLVLHLSGWMGGVSFFLGQSGSEVQQGQGCFRICSTLTRKLLFHLHNTFFSFISISAQRNRHKTVNLVILTSIGKRLISTTYPVWHPTCQADKMLPFRTRERPATRTCTPH